MSGLLAMRDLGEPALWAVVIGWVMSVTLHEFAHGVVAYWGGDYTIRERGGLTLNPLQYVDPLMSIILPVIFLLMGGIPLPGGATYVRHDLIRSKGWDSGVSAAGPAMNLILFGLLAIPLLPDVGWINMKIPATDWTTAQKFVGAMCLLQLLSVILNLVPVPGLDGYGVIAPFLSEDLRERLSAPQVRSLCMFGYFMLLWQAPGFMDAIYRGMGQIMGDVLFPRAARAYNAVFFH
jgi:Zn-dependent protease